MALTEYTLNGMTCVAEEIPPGAVPVEVSSFQGRAALIQSGYMAAIRAYIEHPDTDALVKEAWDSVRTFRRQSLMIMTVALVLGLNDQDLDNLFISAHSIGDV